MKCRQLFHFIFVSLIISGCGTTQLPSSINYQEASRCRTVFWAANKKYDQECLEKISKEKIKEEEDAKYTLVAKSERSNQAFEVEVSLHRNSHRVDGESTVRSIELQIPKLKFNQKTDYIESATWTWFPGSDSLPIGENSYNAYIVAYIRGKTEQVKIDFKIDTSEWVKYKNVIDADKSKSQEERSKRDKSYADFQKLGCTQGSVIIKGKLSAMEYEIGLGQYVGGGYESAILKTVVQYETQGDAGLLALEKIGKKKVTLKNGFTAQFEVWSPTAKCKNALKRMQKNIP